MSRLLKRLPGLLGSVLASPVQLFFAGLDLVGGVPQLQARQRALRERAPLDDADFVESLDLPPSEHSIAIAVREVLASACGVAYCALRPDDQLSELEQLPELLGPPIDWADLLKEIAERAELEIPAQQYDERTWGRVGRDEYVADLKHLVQAMISLSPAHRSRSQSA